MVGMEERSESSGLLLCLNLGFKRRHIVAHALVRRGLYTKRLLRTFNTCCALFKYDAPLTKLMADNIPYFDLVHDLLNIFC